MRHNTSSLASRSPGERTHVWLLLAFFTWTVGVSADECGFGPLLSDGSHTGTAVHNLSLGWETIFDVTVLGDGRIVTLASVDDDLAVTCFRRDGSIDRTFGTAGTTMIDFDGRHDRPTRILTIGGRITTGLYVAGTAGWEKSTDAEGDFGLAKLDRRGRMDLSFGGGDGKVVTGFGDDEYLNDISYAPGGKLVAVGFSSDTGFLGGDDWNYALARYNSDGSLDRSFGGDGKVEVDAGDKWGELKSVFVHPDGSILAGGGYWADPESVLVRFHENGQVDRDFGRNGVVVPPISYMSGHVYGLERLPDQSYIALTTRGVFHLDTEGRVDQSFAGGFGQARVPEAVRGLKQFSSRERFYTVGEAGCRGAVYCYRYDGTLDPEFGEDGVFAIDFNGDRETVCSVVRAVSFQPLGLVVAGNTRNGDGNSHALAKIDWDSQLVTGCEPIDPPPPVAPRFSRGDTNGNSAVDLSDAIATLGYLFTGQQAPACLGASDANDDGQVDVSDALFLLGYLFLGGESIPEPRACGEDPSADALSCVSSCGSSA